MSDPPGNEGRTGKGDSEFALRGKVGRGRVPPRARRQGPRPNPRLGREGFQVFLSLAATHPMVPDGE